MSRSRCNNLFALENFGLWSIFNHTLAKTNPYSPSACYSSNTTCTSYFFHANVLIMYRTFIDFFFMHKDFWHWRLTACQAVPRQLLCIWNICFRYAMRPTLFTLVWGGLQYKVPKSFKVSSTLKYLFRENHCNGNPKRFNGKSVHPDVEEIHWRLSFLVTSSHQTESVTPQCLHTCINIEEMGVYMHTQKKKKQ